ncbi:MAG TPA: glycosyltransferase [Nocardioides sp.]|jgi:UDP-N-acetylglucosamine:LPS N-acetylglucosamine transferase|nr:glycosyltransferase [Nocardioides sp.]
MDPALDLAPDLAPDLAGDTSSPALLPDPAGRRVAIVSGSYGAGHDAVAAEMARRLSRAGALVTTYDVARLLPLGLGRVLKRVYYAQIRRAPATWGTTLAHVEPGQPLHRLAVGALGAGSDRVVAAVAGSDLVIATHPFASQALGVARRRGTLSVPALTYLTDASVHPLWVHPSVDLHLAMHDVAAEQARRWGGRTVTIQPIVRAGRPDGLDPLAAYELMGARALVTGGSLGIGELEEAARDVLATGVMTPVVACGSNTSLRRRLELVPGVLALGWRDDLPDVIASCDCVVQNAGGFTSLEALAVGTPVVTYRPIPGHGVTNAAGLEQANLAVWPRDPAALGDALRQVLVGGRHDRLPHDAPTLVGLLTGTRTFDRGGSLWDEVA